MTEQIVDDLASEFGDEHRWLARNMIRHLADSRHPVWERADPREVRDYLASALRRTIEPHTRKNDAR